MKIIFFSKNENSDSKTSPIKLTPKQRKYFFPNNKIKGQTWETFKLLTETYLLEEDTLNYFFSVFIFCSDVTLDLNEKYNGLKPKDLVKSAISYNKFCFFFNIKPSNLLKRLFHFDILAKDTSAHFEQFVCSLFSLCSLRKEKLKSLLFSLYDSVQNQFISYETVRTLLKDLGLENEFCNVLLKRCNKFLVFDHYKGINIMIYKKFIEFIQSYYDVISPLEEIHIKLRNQLLGEKWWKKTGELKRKLVLELLNKKYLESINNCCIRPATATKTILESTLISKLSTKYLERCQRRQLLNMKMNLSLNRVDALLYKTHDINENIWKDSFLEFKEYLKPKITKNSKRNLRETRKISKYRQELMQRYHNNLLHEKKKRELEATRLTSDSSSYIFSTMKHDAPWTFCLILSEHLQNWHEEQERLSLKLHQGKYSKRVNNYKNTIYRNDYDHFNVFSKRNHEFSYLKYVRNPVEEKFASLIRKYVLFCDQPQYLVGKSQLSFQAERFFTYTEYLFDE